MKELLKAIVKLREFCEHNHCVNCPFNLKKRVTDFTEIEYCGVQDLMRLLQGEPCEWDIDKIIEVMMHE